MYQNDAEVLFPARVVHALAALRGPKWQALVGHVIRLPESDPDALAFGLLMIRLSGCLTCHADSYRAMRGCTICARQSVIRFKGTDEDLVAQWELARDEIECWLKTGEVPAMC